MADSTALNIVISADTSQMVSGLNNAKQQLASFTSSAQTSLQGITSSTQAANDAFGNFANSSTKVGSAARDAAGGTREMRESVEALNVGLTGTGSVSELAAVGLSKFAGSLGGPMLLAASLAVAGIGLLVEKITQYKANQEALSAEAAAFNLPVDQVKDMTKALVDLQSSLEEVKTGMRDLTPAQQQAYSKLGLNTQSNSTDVLKAIQESTGTQEQKITALATVTGQSWKAGAAPLLWTG